MMLTFHIPDMHCDGCVRSLTKAAQALDPGAALAADMASRRVTVTTSASGTAVAEAFQDAGYDVETA
jgi:copper chaperone